MDTLNIPSVKTIGGGELASDLYVVAANLVAKPSKCPYCSSVKFWEFGTRNTRYFDFKLHGKKTLINLKRQRYRCQSCLRTFFHESDAFDPDFQLTSRVVRHIEESAIVKPFTHIADELSIDEKLVRNVFSRYAQKREKEMKPQAGRIVGIDELYLLRQFRCIITNIDQRTITDLLKVRDQGTLTKYLKRMDGRDKIERVCIDMWRPYQQAVEAALPGVPITIDKFHVVKAANYAMEEIRKETQRKLPKGKKLDLMRSRYILLRRSRDLKPKELKKVEQWRRVYPALIDAWELKEHFFRIYDQKTPAAAREAFKQWRVDLPLTVHGQFRELVNMVNNWEEQIFNYFDERVTNAFTECANGIAKVANRTGRGYSFKVIRYKLLFAHSHRKSASSDMTIRSWLNAKGIPFSTFDERSDTDIDR